MFDTIAFLHRGLTEEDFEKVAEFFDRAVKISSAIKDQTGGKIKEYRAALANGPANYPELVQLKEEVTQFSRKFPTVGF